MQIKSDIYGLMISVVHLRRVKFDRAQLELSLAHSSALPVTNFSDERSILVLRQIKKVCVRFETSRSNCTLAVRWPPGRESILYMAVAVGLGPAIHFLAF